MFVFLTGIFHGEDNKNVEFIDVLYNNIEEMVFDFWQRKRPGSQTL